MVFKPVVKGRLLAGVLVFLGVCLFFPGLYHMLQPDTGVSLAWAHGPAGQSHWRGLNAMMAVMGAAALWSAWRLDRARLLIRLLGVMMLAVVAARFYSLYMDGLPDRATAVYGVVEMVLAWLLLTSKTA